MTKPPISVPAESRPTEIDGKFGFKDGKIVNLVSGQEIPQDEPLFLLRARDHHAIETLEAYSNICLEDCNELHLQGTEQVIARFRKFAEEHPQRMKQPGITRHLKLASLLVGESRDEIKRLRTALTDLVTWPGMGAVCERQGDNCPVCRGRTALNGNAGPVTRAAREDVQ